MQISKIIEENEKEFDKTFEHSETCFLQRSEDSELVIGGACYCQLREIKSFLRSSYLTFIRELIEEVEGMKKRGIEDTDFYQESFNEALQKVIDYLKEAK